MNLGETGWMQHIEGSFTSAADGLNLYRQAWLPDAAPKAIVLLFHGLGEHSGRYAHVGKALADAGYAVHALDHRGHGKSDGIRVYVKHYDEFQRDLLQFRHIVQGEHPDVPLVVLGHSMGGNLAVGHVLDHQDGVCALALSGAALKVGDSLSKWKVKLLLFIAKIAPKVRPEGLSAEAISRDPDVVAAYKADPLVFTGKITAGLGAALIRAMRSFPDRYPSLHLPVLLLHGTNDQLADIGGSQQLQQGAVNATITAHYYEGLYHEVFNEPEQAAVIGHLVSWLEQVV